MVCVCVYVMNDAEMQEGTRKGERERRGSGSWELGRGSKGEASVGEVK